MGQEEVPKDEIVKNFADAVSRYTGDDFLEEYNPDSQHDEVEDRGDAYIFVKKDLRGLEPDKGLLDSLKGLIKETTGDGDLEEADDDRPEDEEGSVEEEVVEYREDLGPEDDDAEEPM